MRKQTLRLLLKVGALVNLGLLGLVLWDVWANESAWMTPLLVAYAAFLLAMLLLFFARPQAQPSAPADVRPLDDDGRRLAIAQRP